MSLTRALSTIKKYQRQQIQNDLEGVEVDYYYMSSYYAGSKTMISLMLWTVIVDAEGFIYACRSSHVGDYDNWRDLIRDRIYYHLLDVGVGDLFAKRIVRDIVIKKEGHIIPTDERSSGDRIGIHGADEVYIRKDRFTYI